MNDGNSKLTILPLELIKSDRIIQLICILDNTSKFIYTKIHGIKTKQIKLLSYFKTYLYCDILKKSTIG